ncbi:restriction endonuclease, partial [Bacillus cereus]
AERKCPACKNHLVIRNSNKTGNKFFGCSQYPTCTHTEPINT